LLGGSMGGRAEPTEVIKVEIPKWLAERFRRHVAEKYGLGRGALSRAVADLIERELGLGGEGGTVDPIVGLGLRSDYAWEGEDLVEALRRRAGLVPSGR